jgi:acetyl-CoA acetyltransferase
MLRILFLFLFTAIFLFWEAADFSVQQVLAQNYAKEDEKALIAEKEKQKFLTEMQTLLNAASKAGFSEKEIREITVTRKGKVVHVWDFLEQAKLQQKKDALAKKRSKPRERYLTVMDIAEEMQSGETRDLDAIKDKSTFIGAEEK